MKKYIAFSVDYTIRVLLGIVITYVFINIIVPFIGIDFPEITFDQSLVVGTLITWVGSLKSILHEQRTKMKERTDIETTQAPESDTGSCQVQHSVRRCVGPFSEKTVRSAFTDFAITHLICADDSMVDAFIRSCERCQQNNSTYYD